jgi:hypothetical protein
MSIQCSTAQGFALFFTVFGVLALGCAAGGDGGSESAAPAEPAGAAAEALRWHGPHCPGEAPVTADAEPHAFPGPCEGQGSPDQAIHDGAEEELELHCQGYCGQSSPACAARARLVEVACVDRHFGHRWQAICGCDS